MVIFKKTIKKNLDHLQNFCLKNSMDMFFHIYLVWHGFDVKYQGTHQDTWRHNMTHSDTAKNTNMKEAN